VKKKDIRHDIGNDTLCHGQFHTIQENRTITSPAAAANPDKHLAANRLLKVVVLAVQTRIAKSIKVETTSDARLPNLTPNGTQK
jgi:hypothetical protein